jgi:fructose-bisphosphate aldolase class 1
VLIFEDSYIEEAKFVKVSNIEDINKTSPKDILLLQEFKEPYQLAKYCQQNSLSYAIEASSILDAIYASNLGASYVVASLDLAKSLQELANEYLWDMKVLATVDTKEELIGVAKAFIDGAIFIKRITNVD